jgi:2-(1,2-epoxy-1,2-dihydrophenyl)acetyl-CoA isomerase
MTPSDPVLLIERHERVRLLRLNRAARKNAIDEALGWAIVRAIEDAARDDEVWVVGITGAGDAFCSGLDLAPPSSSGERPSPLSRQDELLDELGWVGRFPVVMRERCDKPIVAGVNGVAIGAGFSLAMAADIRIASAKARFLAGYARVGTSPDGGLTWTLSQAIGYEQALRVLLEGEMIAADDALARGIVSEVVAADEFEKRLLGYCESLAKGSPIAARQTKRMLSRAVVATSLEAHAREELLNARRGLGSEDSAEARKAILEKRAPEFKGR